MPVAAVMWGGRPTVNSGSDITMAGTMVGWKMIFLTLISSLVMTLERPTSEPVPDVVGTATTGARPSSLTRVQLSPTSSKSQSGLS